VTNIVLLRVIAVKETRGYRRRRLGRGDGETGEDDNPICGVVREDSKQVSDFSLIAQISELRTTESGLAGKPFVVPKRGKWQRLRNIVFETELEIPTTAVK
jgi:hypothetical protein